MDHPSAQGQACWRRFAEAVDVGVAASPLWATPSTPVQPERCHISAAATAIPPAEPPRQPTGQTRFDGVWRSNSGKIERITVGRLENANYFRILSNDDCVVGIDGQMYEDPPQ